MTSKEINEKVVEFQFKAIERCDNVNAANTQILGILGVARLLDEIENENAPESVREANKAALEFIKKMLE